MFWPCETRTSTCRSFATISSGLYRFLAIAVLLDVKDIPQVGPLQWGWIIVMAKGGGAEIGATKRTHAANHHEVRLVQLCFDFYMIEAKPEDLIGDRTYDSDPLDEEKDGIEMIAPHRTNRCKPPTQDR